MVVPSTRNPSWPSEAVARILRADRTQTQFPSVNETSRLKQSVAIATNPMVADNSRNRRGIPSSIRCKTAEPGEFAPSAMGRCGQFGLARFKLKAWSEGVEAWGLVESQPVAC